jgi:hypothetical protein
VAGYLIALTAFLIPFGLSLVPWGRPVKLVVIGGLLAVGSVVAVAARRMNEVKGNDVVPIWFVIGLIALLYAIWCGGALLGVRLRRMRAS